MRQHASLPVLTATIFALLGDMSEDVARLTENRELFAPVPAHTLGVPLPADLDVSISSLQVPDDELHPRGAVWQHKAWNFDLLREINIYDQHGTWRGKLQVRAEDADSMPMEVMQVLLDHLDPAGAEDGGLRIA